MSLDLLLRALGLRGAPTHHGSAGWTEPPRELLRPKRGPLPEGGFYLGRSAGKRVVLPKAETLRHGLIVGGSGTGKSRGFFLPNAAWSRGTSLVCTDPKSELWRFTSGLRERAIRYAPAEPEASECFNWIPLCADPRLAELCARAVVESGNTKATDQAWLDTEAAFLAAVFAHASTLSAPTPLSAYRLFTRQPIENLIAGLLASPSEAAREQGMVFSQTQERMRGSIVPVVAAKLQFLRDPKVARFTSAKSEAPDFSSLRVTPTSVYWCLKEHDIARLRPLTGLFFSLLLERLSVGGEDGEGVPALMLLDEFANIGTIPDFETTLSLARGRGVGIWMGIQSLGQLEARYGKANAQTILSNCGTKIALSGLDVESAEYFSRALGEKTASEAKTTRHGLLNASYGHSRDEHGRRLLTADEVRRIGADESLAIVGNRRPMRLEKIFYDEAPSVARTKALGQPRAIDVNPPAVADPPAIPDFMSRSRARARGKKAQGF